MAEAYPLDLRTFMRDEKSRSSPATFSIAQPRRGFGYVDPIGTDVPVFWDVTLRFTRAEAQTFRLWFVYTLQRGLREFTIPIDTEFGQVTYTLQFLPDSLLPLRQTGEVFEYRATVMARAEIVPPSLVVALLSNIPNQSATQGTAFSLALAPYFTGGTVPYTYTVDSGTLPAGLTLNSSTGVVSGTPTTPALVLDVVFRVTDSLGSTVVSNAVDFDVSSTADPFFANVVALLHMDGANNATTFTDSSSYARPMTAFGDAKLTTGDKKFGTAAATFDGAGDYVRTNSMSSDFELFNAPFTIEFFGKWSSAVANQCLLQIDDTTSNVRANISIVAGTIVFFTSSASSNGGTRISVAAPAADAWHHIALVRVDTGPSYTITLYVDGVSVGTTSTTILPSSVLMHLSVGSSASGGGGTQHFAGLIDEVRVTKGVARYTANFTPPAEAFPNS